MTKKKKKKKRRRRREKGREVTREELKGAGR